jgi:putative transposase
MQARTASKREVGDGGQLPLLIAPTPRRKRRVKRGRPKQAGAGTPHQRRPSLSPHHPVHVVLRVVKAIGSLRRRLAYHAIRNATITVAERRDFQIVHLSLQRTHIHLLVEADDRKALSRGMQSFQIAAAKQLNRLLSKGGPRRRGRVFSDRYYAEIIKSPRQAHHALSYVLNNWRKHAEDRDPRMHGWTFDWFSSGWTFPDWAERPDAHFLPRPPPTYESLIVRRPSTWLLCEGYKKHGPISFHAIPSAHQR